MYNNTFTRVFKIRGNGEPEYLPKTGVKTFGKNRIVVFAPIEKYAGLIMNGDIIFGRGIHITYAQCGNPTIYNEESVIAKAEWPSIIDWWLERPSVLSPADECRIDIYIELECEKVELCGF